MALRDQVSVLAALSVLSCAACSNVKYPETVAVTGKVTLNGQPLAGATVAFHPKSDQPDGRMGSGATDANGRYSLTTFRPRDGVVPGTYAVTISKASAGAAAESTLDAKSAIGGMSPDMMKMMKGAAGGSKKKKTSEDSEVPAKFSNPQSSGLTREVSKQGPNSFDFEL